MQFKDILKQLRKSKKITQKELADNIGISEISIRSYESGRRLPNSETLVKLENYFNVSGAYLRGETDQKTPMEKWEDPELMDAMDDSVDYMLKNISKLLSNQPERTRSDYFRFLVEFQRIFKYNPELQNCIIDILVNALSACSRTIDTSWEIKNSGACENDPKYAHIAEREIKNISEDIHTMISFIDYE